MKRNNRPDIRHPTDREEIYSVSQKKRSIFVFVRTFVIFLPINFGRKMAK